MKVTYMGHACILVDAGGTRVLMDPWLSDPTYHGTWWHYPPLVLGVRDLPQLDYVYISHEHPDHFDPPTLRQIDRDVTILIANFKQKGFRDRIAALGFRNIRELDFGRDVPLNGTGLAVHIIAPDRPWDDSAILLRDRSTTLLNVNDCHLDDGTLARLGERESIDIAFLTFTGASQYPGCFEFPLASKVARCRTTKQAHLQEFVHWTRLLQAKRAVPAAGNYALLAPDQLFLNTPNYVSTPQEAIEALAAAAPEIDGMQMNPGDTWSKSAGHQRLNPPPDWSKRMEDIETLSRCNAGRVAEYLAAEEPAPADLYERFKGYFEGLRRSDPDGMREVGIVTWWRVTGPAGGDWTLDFTGNGAPVRQGRPEVWNLRLEIPDRLVHLGVSEKAKWENLVLSFRVRLARRPDRYMKVFWTWFCKLSVSEPAALSHN